MDSNFVADLPKRPNRMNLVVRSAAFLGNNTNASADGGSK